MVGIFLSLSSREEIGLPRREITQPVGHEAPGSWHTFCLSGDFVLLDGGPGRLSRVYLSWRGQPVPVEVRAESTFIVWMGELG